MRKWAICSGPDWYRPSVTSTKQIVRQFQRDGYHVLWVNPIAFKSPFVNSSNKSSARKKIKNKILTHLRWFRRDGRGFWVLVPLYLPAFGTQSEAFNRRLVALQVGVCCLLLGIRMKSSILWISGSFTAEGLLPRPFKRKVYQAADLISGFRDASPELTQRLRERERNLCDKADVVFAASEKIAEKLVELCGDTGKVKLLLHGVDFEHFTRPVELAASIKRIRALGKPVAGYFGSLSDANDKEVFLSLADHGFSVVVIGKVLGDYAALSGHESIHFLGSVPYPELPAYASGFDIALLNWRMHEWILNSFPIKALEYLALGLPVVSCKIPVLMKYFSDQMAFVDTPEEFVDMAKQIVNADTAAARNERKESVRSWSWVVRFAFVKETLNI